MSNRAQIIGSYLSPYVRKVLVFLELKGIPYEVDPIVPFYGFPWVSWPLGQDPGTLGYG